MKKSGLLIILLGVAGLSWAQESETPWGMLALRPGVYVDDTEVSVAEWLEFYHYGQGKSSPTDTTYRPHFPPEQPPAYAFLFEPQSPASVTREYGDGITTSGYAKLPLPKDSVRSPKQWQAFRKKYLDQPITFISYGQALAYCAWRTALYQATHPNQLIIRLPSREEFTSWNENVDSLRILKKRVIPSGNYADVVLLSRRKQDETYQDCGKRTLPMASFYSNDNGLYDIQGNVAEMTLEEGEAVGGSFGHPYRESLKKRVIRYNKPEAWLGFRCTAVRP